MNEIITRNEVLNDGSRIHLYFNGLIGLYAAYGYSAYQLSKLTTVSTSYSESMMMPVVVMNAAHLDEVKSHMKVESQDKGYFCLVVNQPGSQDGYEEWASEIHREGKHI